MFLMPYGVQEISKIEKDPEVFQEKKNRSYLMSPRLCLYIYQVMKTSSLGWFIGWKELGS